MPQRVLSDPVECKVLLRAKTLRLDVVEKLLCNSNEVWRDFSRYNIWKLGKTVLPGDKAGDKMVQCLECHASNWSLLCCDEKLFQVVM